MVRDTTTFQPVVIRTGERVAETLLRVTLQVLGLPFAPVVELEANVRPPLLHNGATSEAVSPLCGTQKT